MTGFEAWISGVRGDCSTNWTTTTAPLLSNFGGLEAGPLSSKHLTFQRRKMKSHFSINWRCCLCLKKKLFWIFVDFFLIDFLTFLKEKKVWKLIFLKVFSFPQSGFKNFSPFFQFFFLGDAAENHFGTFSIKNILASILWAVYKLVF